MQKAGPHRLPKTDGAALLLSLYIRLADKGDDIVNIKLKKALCPLTAMLLIMTLCGGMIADAEGPADFVPALDTDAACELRVVGSYTNFEALEAVFDDFNGVYPNVVLNYSPLDDYNERIVGALAQDSPNIFFTASWMADMEVYAPLFEAAEDLADPALGLDLGCIREGLLFRDASGRVPMAPIFSTSYGMLVNEALFAEHDIAIPRSYAELPEVCRAFRAAGFDTPVLGYFKDDNPMICALAYPDFCGRLKGDPEAVEALNSEAPGAEEHMRPTLELVKDFMDSGCVNTEACRSLEDNYNRMILRFFEGDIPMLFCGGDAVSGTAKRESRSEAFTARPFPYSFHPIPVTEKGGWFVQLVPVAFSVNANCENLDMTNEFMRFLLCTEELNEMARVKHLMTVSADFRLEGVWAPFGEADEAHTVCVEALGLHDAAAAQLRAAAAAVADGSMGVEEAIAACGHPAEPEG